MDRGCFISLIPGLWTICVCVCVCEPLAKLRLTHMYVTNKPLLFQVTAMAGTFFLLQHILSILSDSISYIGSQQHSHG